MTPNTCPGDCGQDGAVTIDELIVMVRVALDEQSVLVCPAGDLNGDGEITVEEIITAVNAGLSDCPFSGGQD